MNKNGAQSAQTDRADDPEFTEGRCRSPHRLPYIAVGRKNEIEALLHDVDIIAEGGASFRFIVGRYGFRQELF